MKNGTDKELLVLSPVPALLSALREYRNISAHNAINRYQIGEDDARVVINMQLNLLCCIKKHKELWNLL